MVNTDASQGMSIMKPNTWFSKDQQMKDAKIATSAFLPKWGDVCFNTVEASTRYVTVEEALKQIHQIDYCMNNYDMKEVSRKIVIN